MTAYFLDTSAFLKRYLNEDGSEAVDRIFEEYSDRCISAVGLLETYSNIQRLHSVDRILTLEQYRSLCATIASDVESGRVTVRNATPQDIDAAVIILTQRYVTAIDALQIATAHMLGPGVVLVSADRKLNRLARDVGLEVLEV